MCGSPRSWSACILSSSPPSLSLSSNGATSALLTANCWTADPSLDPSPISPHPYRMKTRDLADRLDVFLRVDDYTRDDSAEIEDFCREANIPLERYATPDFMRRLNGIMLHNANDVEWVFT